MNIKNKKTKKGFTLVEMMVSIFVFIIIMVAIVDIFARQINSYKYANNLQTNVENAQFALNYMAKTLRTSSILGYADDSSYTNLMTDIQADSNNDNDFYLHKLNNEQNLVIYDFSQEACIKFGFEVDNAKNTSSLQMVTCKGVGILEIEKCLTASVWAGTGGYTCKKQRLTTGNVSGTIYAAPTRYMDEKGSRNTDTIGRATISLQVEGDKTTTIKNAKPVYVQTSVSLRDYPSDISF
jgi:prepilin-type N-terminal cleavage/methylation domain-containing protein